MTYWVTRVNSLKRNPNGDHAEIEVTGVSFETSAEARAYVDKKNKEHHEYMLKTHDPNELGFEYGYMTSERLQGARQRGITIRDKRP